MNHADRIPGFMSGRKAAIIGAGPTGLGTGVGLLLNGYDGQITVIEKAKRPGGLAGSFRWNGHIVDFGPHRLSPNIPEIRMLASELLGPDLLIQKSQHGVQIGNRLYQFPPRVVDWLNPDSLGDLMLFGLSFLASGFSWITRRFEPDTFETIIANRFGRRFYDQIIAPMARKVWIDPRHIDPSFAELRFAQIHPFEVIKKILLPKQELNPSAFLYPRLGFQQIWDNMAEWLTRENHELLYESEAVTIHVEKNVIRAIEVRGPEGLKTIEGDGLAVVSTIPLGILVKLLNGFETEPLIAQLSQIKIRSMILVAVEFDRPETLPFRTLIFPQETFRFNRLFEQNKYSAETVSPGKSVVVADITVDPKDEMLGFSDERLIELVKADLHRLPYIDMGRAGPACVVRVPYAYVVPDRATRGAMFDITHRLKAITNLWLRGRFSVGEYDNSDYAIDHGLNLSAMIVGRMTRLEYMTRIHDRVDRSIVG